MGVVDGLSSDGRVMTRYLLTWGPQFNIDRTGHCRQDSAESLLNSADRWSCSRQTPPEDPCWEP